MIAPTLCTIFVDGTPLDGAALTLLTLAAVATSMLSAIVGMAGGFTLLAVMLLFVDPLVAIPLHGVIQLVSNSSRTVVQRAHLRRDIIGRYAILLLPMGFVGLALVERLPPTSLKGVIGAFVLLATWAPQLLLLGSNPEASDPQRRFILLGGVVGVVNIAVGATGPLIAPFFLNLGLTRFELIGTKAACQTLAHLAKLIVFGVAGFAFRDYLPLLGLMVPAVVAGTWLGSRLLEHVNEVWFVRAYRTVLTVIALWLLWSAISG